MHLSELVLLTSNLTLQCDFYRDVLHLPILIETDEQVVVQAGATRLVLNAAPLGWEGFYHFAFNIPKNQFHTARAWIAKHVPLIPDGEGKTEFHSESWNAHSFYFYDAAGNILECIARHNLDNASAATFSQHAFLNISEIGLVSTQVQQTVTHLTEQAALSPFNCNGDDAFCPVGDEQGLFIVVKTGRVWFPETSKPAAAYPLEAAFRAGNNDYHLVSGDGAAEVTKRTA